MLAQLPVRSARDRPDRRPPEQGRTGDRPEPTEGRTVLRPYQPDQHRHRPHQVVGPGDRRHQHPGRGTHEHPEDVGRRPECPAGEGDAGDEDRRARQGDQPGGHHPVVEPVHDGPQALVADVEHPAHPLGVGGVLRPVGPRDAGVDGSRQRRTGHEGAEGDPCRPGLAGDEQIRNEDQRDQLDGGGDTHQDATRQRARPDAHGAGQVGQDECGQDDVDLTEREGELDRLYVERRCHQEEGEQCQAPAVDARKHGSDREPQQCEEGRHVRHAPQDLGGPGGEQPERDEHQSGERRVREREVGCPGQRCHIEPAVEQVGGAHQVDRDVELAALRRRDRSPHDQSGRDGSDHPGQRLQLRRDAQATPDHRSDRLVRSGREAGVDQGAHRVRPGPTLRRPAPVGPPSSLMDRFTCVTSSASMSPPRGAGGRAATRPLPAGPGLRHRFSHEGSGLVMTVRTGHGNDVRWARGLEGVDAAGRISNLPCTRPGRGRRSDCPSSWWQRPRPRGSAHRAWRPPHPPGTRTC